MTAADKDDRLENEVWEDEDVEELDLGSISAVVSGTDWTTETIVSQLRRGNIDLNPRFQRRDAWRADRKSRLVESLMLGLPVPQIVLAESEQERGKFIVLDGKQRLLAILQYWGEGEGPDNGFALKGLPLRTDLNGLTFAELSSDPAFEGEFNALCNQSVRTVVIRNWLDTGLLHTVFLRLNTGSVALSPQELRQALLPGPFSDFVDDAAAVSEPLRELLGLAGRPDPRMRDVEILARHIAFKLFASTYPGRMKRFLDDTFRSLNKSWKRRESEVGEVVAEFNAGLAALLGVFGRDLARKPTSRQFNRAIFDALVHFHSQRGIRTALAGKDAEVRAAYDGLFADGSEFATSIESDTASPHNTAARLRLWAEALADITDSEIAVPKIPIPKPVGAKKAKGQKKKQRKA